MIIACLKSGLAQVRANKRMLAIYYLSNLFFALLLAAPLRFLLGNFIGASQMGERLGGALDMDFVFEFIKQNLASFSIWTGMFLLVPLAYWLFNLFLSGGALATFARQEKFSPVFFWGQSAKYFGRFVRLALWSAPVLIALFCVQYLETGARLLIFGNDAYQNITHWGGWVRTALLGLGLIVFGMILDYARIHTVLHEETKMRLSLWQALKFTLRNFLPALGLALALAIVGAFALLLYNPIADRLNAPNGLIVFLLFIWQQLYMLVRAALRLALYAGETHLFQELAVQPEPAEYTRPLEAEGSEGLSLATE